MRLSSLLMKLGLLVLAVSVCGCSAFTGCLGVGGPDSDDPFLRQGVVRIQRTKGGTTTTIGYSTADMENPQKAWFLLSDTEQLAIEIHAGDTISFVHVSDEPISPEDLCTTYSVELTNPKLWGALQAADGVTDCPPIPE